MKILIKIRRTLGPRVTHGRILKDKDFENNAKHERQEKSVDKSMFGATTVGAQPISQHSYLHSFPSIAFYFEFHLVAKQCLL